MNRRRTASIWFAVTALIVGASLIAQIGLTISGVDAVVGEDGQIPAVGTRLVRFFSYFTVESNILVLISAVTLVLKPNRDGLVWRVLRLCGLVGISVTFVIYLWLLRPILVLDGLAVWTDAGLHIASPLLAITGWALFGPWPRIELKTILWMLIWPLAYVTWTLAHGANSLRWYPYPFIDAKALGYGTALLNGVGILVLLVAVGFAYFAGDRALTRRSARGVRV